MREFQIINIYCTIFAKRILDELFKLKKCEKRKIIKF